MFPKEGAVLTFRHLQPGPETVVSRLMSVVSPVAFSEVAHSETQPWLGVPDL